MMVAGQWLRPERYIDPKDEVHAVNERVGLIDVNTLGKLQLTGPGVPDFLERVCMTSLIIIRRQHSRKYPGSYRSLKE